MQYNENVKVEMLNITVCINEFKGKMGYSSSHTMEFHNAWSIESNQC